MSPLAPHSPFRARLGRVFVLYGQVHDHVCTPDGRLLHPDLWLAEVLHASGAEAVAFVGGRGVSFPDAASSRSFRGVSAPSRAPGKAPSKLAGPPGGLSLRRRPPPDPSEDEEPRLLRGLQDSAELGPRLSTWLSEPGPMRVVVIDPDAIHAFNRGEDANRTYLRAVIQSELERSGPGNHNLLVLRYPLERVDALSARLREHGLDWLLPHEGPGRARLVRLGPPGVDEVQALVDRHRLRQGLGIDWERRAALEVELAAWMQAERQSLTGLSSALDGVDRLDDRALTGLTGAAARRTVQERLDGLVGLQEAKDLLQRLQQSAALLPRPRAAILPSSFVHRLVPPPRRSGGMSLHGVLSGSPGTGKTTIASLLGDWFRESGLLPLGHLVRVTRADLVAGFVGQTALKTADAVERARGGVLFVDEAYDLVRSETDSFGQEAMTVLVEAMSRLDGQLAVVFAGYPDDIDRLLTTNQGLPSRFGWMLRIEDYDGDALAEVFRRRLAAHPSSPSIDPALDRALPAAFGGLVDHAERGFGNAREAVALADGALRAALTAGGREVCIHHLPSSLRAHLDAPARDESGVLDRLDALVGLDSVKDVVRRRCALLEVQARRANAAPGSSGGPPAPGHYLFVGRPGTGKTEVARLMGEQLHAIGALPKRTFVARSAKELIGAYVGQSEAATLEFLRSGLGGVIFIDEAHQLAGSSERGGGFGQAVIDALVPFSEDHRHDCTIVLAGYPGPMDRLLAADAGLAGRFPHRVEFPDYDAEELRDILLGMAAGQGLQLDGDLLQALVPALDARRGVEGAGWANARSARNFLDRIKENQAFRVRPLADGSAELFVLRREDLQP